VARKFVTFGEDMHTKKTEKLVYRERENEGCSKCTAEHKTRTMKHKKERGCQKALSSGVPGPNETELHSLALGPRRYPVILQHPSFDFQLKCSEISFYYLQPKIIY